MNTDLSEKLDRVSKALASGGETLADFPEISSAIAAVLAAAAPANAACGTLAELVASVIEEAARAVRCDPSAVRPVGIYGCWGPAAVMAVTEAVSDKCAELGGRSASADLVCASLAVSDTLATAREILEHEMLDRVVAACRRFAQVIDEKAREFSGIRTVSRSLMQDADPVDLGGEFSGYAQGFRRVASSMEQCRDGANLSMLGAGESGSGYQVPEDFAIVATAALSDVVGYEMVPCGNFYDGLAAVDRALLAHAHMQSTAVVLWRLCRDLEVLSSGPRGGIREIALPAVAPGSSIMPGKINPTVAEMGCLVAEQVSANHTAMSHAVHMGILGHSSSSVLPAKSLIESGNLLVNAMDILERKVVRGLVAFPQTCQRYADTAS